MTIYYAAITISKQKLTENKYRDFDRIQLYGNCDGRSSEWLPNWKIEELNSAKKKNLVVWCSFPERCPKIWTVLELR